MKKYNIYLIIKSAIKTTSFMAIISLVFILQSCKKELDVQNPNDPTFGVNVTSESGLADYAKGSTYWNGFTYGNGWLGDSYFSLPWGYHELMGDAIGGGQGSNNQTTTMGVPQKFQADPADASSVFTNPSPQVAIIRSFNTSAASANENNAMKYEWNSMYALIKSCNIMVEQLANVDGLAADKVNAVKAWSYWWKGYAYSQLGSLYYAALVVDKSNTIFSTYVDHNAIITESNKNLNQALTTLKAVSNQTDFNAMITRMTPAQNQVGLGKALTSDQFIRTVNTMLARNIVINKLAPFVNGNPNATIAKASMGVISSADWSAVVALCTAGIKQGDNVFTGRSTAANSFFSATGGTVASLLSISNQTSTYKLSERLVQQFKADDKRRANFSTAKGTFYGDANTNSTRYTLLDGVTENLKGIPILGSRQAGGIEVYIGPTFEENALMLAEAKIRTGAINEGLILIDAVRSYQGAGVAALAGTNLALAPALTELTMERLAALAFRGLSYFDLRRWGWTYSIANGGGRYGSTLLFKNTVFTNATIDYNYMDFWDVPADELDKNPPAAGSAVIKNPNF
ncbi:MAG: RagB/SusD family nutrient uptake outer membrane protein [Saprospiraceae bacterium]